MRLGNVLDRWVVFGCSGVFFGRLGAHGIT
jgi:hypothetical protein